jgi:hypothetical protein
LRVDIVHPGCEGRPPFAVDVAHPFHLVLVVLPYRGVGGYIDSEQVFNISVLPIHSFTCPAHDATPFRTSFQSPTIDEIDDSDLDLLEDVTSSTSIDYRGEPIAKSVEQTQQRVFHDLDGDVAANKL